MSGLGERLRPVLRGELTTRCKMCAGTGVSLRSALDCTPCDGSGIRPDLREQEDAAIERVVAALRDELLSEDAIERACRVYDADWHDGKDHAPEGAATWDLMQAILAAVVAAEDGKETPFGVSDCDNCGATEVSIAHANDEGFEWCADCWAAKDGKEKP